MVIAITDPSGQVARLLDAALAVQQLEPPSALVGGVGVICRLATPHRPTLDADTVVERTGTDILSMLRSRPDAGAPTDDTTVTIGGAKIEIIEVDPVDPAALATQVDDDRDRLFVAAHRWALDSATAVTVDTVPTTGERRLMVATPAALAATKTHALVGRRGGSEHKAGSDLVDVVMLFETFDRDGALTEQLRAAPYGLGRLVAGQLRGLLADPQRRTRTIGLARQAVGPAMNPERIETAMAWLLDA